VQASDIISLPAKAVRAIGLHLSRVGTIFGRLWYTLRVSMLDFGYWSPGVRVPAKAPTPEKVPGIHGDSPVVERLFESLDSRCGRKVARHARSTATTTCPYPEDTRRSLV
jgi:hypothetical protein